MEMIKIYQNKYEGEAKFIQTEQQLNLKKNENVYMNAMGE